MQSKQIRKHYGMTLSACLWLGLFPLMQGGSYSHITRDKWTCMLILFIFTYGCFLYDWILSIYRQKKAGRKSVIRIYIFPLLFACLLFLWTALSSFCSGVSPATWWYGESARMEGLFSQLFYFLIFIFFFFSRIHLKPVLYSAAAGLVFFGVIALLQRAGGNPLGLYPPGRSYELNPEFQSTIGNIDMGTGFLLLLAGLFFYSILDPFLTARSLRRLENPSKGSAEISRHQLLPLIVYIPAFLFTLYLIVTMDVQFGVISLGVLFLVTFFRFLPKSLRLPLLILLLVAVFLVVWFWPGQSGGLWELHEILHGRGRMSFGSDRVAVWIYSLQLAGKNLLLGGGSGTFPARFNQYLTDNGLVIPNEQDGVPLPDYFDNPHNEYIAQLTDHGIPALFLFLALLLFVVFRRREGCLPLLTPCSAAVLCYMVQAFFSFSVCIVAPMFWMILGISFSERR